MKPETDSDETPKAQTNDPLYQAAQMIENAHRMVILTGAGMSTESGLPDFRSPSGWWRRMDPRTVATVEALEQNYDLFHAFYVHRVRHLEQAMPHRGHHVLKKWEDEGKIRLIATQNVDGLHQMAGSRRVQELHGSLRSFRCHTCGKPAEQHDFLEKNRCECGGKLRPNVVLFGEALPQEAWNQTVQSMEQADLVLVIGTSMQVSPVNRLPFLTKGKLILINLEKTGKESFFDIHIEGGAEASLTAIQERLEEKKGC